MHTQTIGSRRQVWNGTAKKTSGGLTKAKLMMSKGRIVSRSKHNSAKREMRLLKYGYGTRKGKFGYVKLATGSRRRSRRSRGSRKSRRGKRGGGNAGYSPADANASYMIQDVVPQSFNPLDRSLVGGRRRRRRGGSGMSRMSEPGLANWAGDGLASSAAPLEEALMAASGGRRRRHRRHRRRHRGGTGSKQLMPASLGSMGVQTRAGMGN